MTGLEKMKNQILDEAKAEADGILQNARDKSDEIIKKAEADAKKHSETIAEKAKTETKNYHERMASSIDLQKRTRLLSTKQEIISDVLAKAYERAKNLPTKEYFDLLLKLLSKYALQRKGEICFSAADLARLPEGYAAEITRIASEKGGELTISSQGKAIDNGFILIYGGIEENCTLKAVFDAKADELSDIVYKTLF
ncbi:MAG: V-type ATP synthase subunit E [Lachnospiraceae bacterium]|nr:V-type ATP synthase subunit E [Lachnospiraceae bacterium]